MVLGKSLQQCEIQVSYLLDPKNRTLKRKNWTLAWIGVLQMTQQN